MEGFQMADEERIKTYTQWSDEPATIRAAHNVSFSRTGYSFVKWNTEPDGSGTDYNPGDKPYFSQSMTLYAQWIINQYT